MSAKQETVFGTGTFTRARLSAADQVLDDLRSKIYSGELPKGTKLPSEKDLAAYYAVSPPTVSEAIRALSVMKLVEARHGSGTFVIAETSALMSEALNAVVELENVDLESILDLSDVVYEKSVSLGVTRATEEEIAELRDAAERFRQPAHSSTEFAVALEHFLVSLVRVSHNNLLIAMSRFLIRGHLAIARESALISTEMWDRVAQELIDERLAVVVALERRDATSARDAIRQYTARGRELLRANAATRPADGREPSVAQGAL